MTGANGNGEGRSGAAPDVLGVFEAVAVNAPQMLMRQVSDDPRRWWQKGPAHELRWHPRGRGESPEWVKITRNPERELPGRIHPQDWWDVRAVARGAWLEQDHRFVAWTSSLYMDKA